MKGVDFHKWTSITYDEYSGGIRPWRPFDYEPAGSGKPIILPNPSEQPSALKFKKGAPVPLSVISTLLYYACGPTKKLAWGSSYFMFRAAPSAGALYPYEVYLAADNVEGLTKGIYRYQSDYAALEAVTSGSKPIEDICKAAFVSNTPPFAIVITGLVFRSAEKYGDRGYRYALLDIGHLLLNISWTAKAIGIESTHALDFNDALANETIGCNTEFEETFAIWLPEDVQLNASCISEPTSVTHKYRAVEFHRGTHISKLKQTGQGAEPITSRALPDFDIASAIRVRRSERDFVYASLDTRKETVLRESAICAFSERTHTIVAKPEIFIVKTSKDRRWQLERFETKDAVSQGADSRAIIRAALGQDFCGRAGFWVLFAAELEKSERNFGTRAYRHLLTLSGIVGESAYLAASSMGLGTCGIGAFCDLELRQALKLPDGLWPLYFVCVGNIKY